LKDDNLREFAIIFMALSEVFVGKEKPSKQLIEIYFRALQQYDIEQIKDCCNILIKTWGFKFLPLPAEFIKIISGTESDKSILAWENVIKQLNEKGVNNVDFNEPTTRAINSCGGLMSIGHCEIEKLDFKRKTFLENYKVMAKHEFKAIENNKLKEITRGIG
jgi:hypothetical protein